MDRFRGVLLLKWSDRRLVADIKAHNEWDAEARLLLRYPGYSVERITKLTLDNTPELS